MLAELSQLATKKSENPLSSKGLTTNGQMIQELLTSIEVPSASEAGTPQGLFEWRWVLFLFIR